MTREQWNSLTTKHAGSSAWNDHAKYWQAFRDPNVVAVTKATAPSTGLWQDVQVALRDGTRVWRRLIF